MIEVDMVTQFAQSAVSQPILLAADPRASYAAHREEIDQAIRSVLESGCYILGEQVSSFEEEFAGYNGVQFCIGVASGTDALLLGLRACGIGNGDAVVTVSHTAVATVCAIHLVGATPVLTDIEPATFTLDLNRLEGLLNGQLGSRIKAIIPVHLYGHPVHMPAVMELASRHNLYVIEDCAQAHGATCQNKKAGSFGHFGAFSFYPTKNLSALGDGGALITNDDKLAERARMLRQYGWKQRYISVVPGMNSRLDELQAAILRVKLRYLDQDNGKRRKLAGSYGRLLSGSGISMPRESTAAVHVYHQYVVRSQNRDGLRAYLKRGAVETSILYPVPVHLQPGYQELVVADPAGLHETERACQEIVSLPMHAELADDQVCRIADLVLRWKPEHIS